MQKINLKSDSRKQKRASLTVEASLVLPFFVFAVLFFLYFFQFLYLLDSVQSSITEAGKFISRYEMVTGEEELSEVAKRLILKQKFYQCLDKTSIQAECIIGGIYGISLGMSQIMEAEQEIEIVAMYQVQFPIPFWGEKTSWVTQKVKTRVFAGCPMKYGKVHDNEEGQEENVIDDLQVYITESGTVYHTSEACTHLKLSISGISADQIKAVRNDNGGRYKACEKCAENEHMEETVYITRDGDRYHNSLSCSGLKRTVHMVYYSDVIGMSKCTRCN